MLIVAVGCGPGPSSPGTDRVPEAALPRPVVLGGIEMCGEAEPVLVLLQGTEHPTWEPVSAERGGHVIRWHAFTPHQLADQGRPNGFAIRETVCGRTDPDVLTLEVVDGRVAEVNAAWSVPAADPSEALSCKQALEQGLGSTRGTPATHRDEWDAREMVMWVWSEPGLKTEVLIDTYNGADDWELLHDIPRRGTGVDPIFRPDDMEVGDVRVLMRFRCTPIVQQLARDMLREEPVRD
jgi:hypothetical protein